MNRILLFLSVIVFSCSAPKTEAIEQKEVKPIKIPVYAWMGGPGKATDEEIKTNFADLKSKGIDVLMYNLSL
ncbi:MAG: hypothetical protein NWS46_10765, partial [Cyclobacteriaceae bacterium]|nr:hypothetical protein [Cyclobacteriaceae bacterium]